MIGPCRERVELSARLRECGQPGVDVSIPCPAGRPNAVGGPYCDAHGGEARARAEAERDWNLLAPASVGDAEAVLAAGNLHLTTRDAYLVLRRQRGHWFAALGIGLIMTDIPNPATCMRWPAGEREPAGAPRRRRGESDGDWRTRCATVGSCRFPSREAAENAGRRAWRESLGRHVREIREARGGTLDWGVLVTPRAEPIVIVLAPGQNAWEEACRLVGKTGIIGTSGEVT